MAIGIREAREALPSLVKRAAYAGEDIHVGTRGADEVTLVSSGKYTKIRDELAALRAEVSQLRRRLLDAERVETAATQPFAGLQRALDTGRLSVAPAEGGARTRRLIPGDAPSSDVSREERIRLGSRGNPEPAHRRRSPRA